MIINPYSFAAGAFSTPSDVASIWEWWEAEREGLADNTAMSQFTGQKNARHFTQGTGANQPILRTNQINSLAAIRFAGSPKCFDSGPDMSALLNAHCFLIVKIDTQPPGASATSGLWTMGNDAASPDVYPDTSGNWRMSPFYHSRQGPTTPPTLTAWHVLEVISQASTATPNGYIWRINGTTFRAAGNSNVTAQGNTSPKLGRSLASTFLVGYIGGMYLFSARLTDGGADRNNMVSYINTRFGLSAV